ncbi:12935_t:CDS:2 [Funneliformis mosseae]|uniref:12935_t:CDS:1 n=1 Tax=Funneliformis mosseae TaxID=27381 RepID=A0A9N9BA15_FUNMO|nr:12935_t:CDS:2 [Funneliformis mosseae]
MSLKKITQRVLRPRNTSDAIDSTSETDKIAIHLVAKDANSQSASTQQKQKNVNVRVIASGSRSINNIDKSCDPLCI